MPRGVLKGILVPSSCDELHRDSAEKVCSLVFQGKADRKLE